MTTTKAYSDPAGRLKTVTLPNNLAVTYDYDKDSHVTSLTYGSLGTLTYDYDADGRRTSLGGSFAATTIPAPQTFSYNADNSLGTLGSATVGNDSNGDLTCLTGTSCGEFSYDARGHLGNITTDSLSVTFSYDAFGRRYQYRLLILGNTTTENYQYDGLNPVAVWVGTVSSTFNLAGLDLDDWFMQSSGGVNDSYLRDALGSTIALTDSSQTLQEQYTYDPYGNTSASGTPGYNPFQFIGREDDYAGLYFMRSRYYNPAIARFVSRDPAGFAGGINLYAYAGDDPVDFSDPTGTIGIDFGEVACVCPIYTSVQVGPGGFYPPQPAPVPNFGGIDNDVPSFYDGSQNGGGLGDFLQVALSRKTPYPTPVPGSSPNGTPQWSTPDPFWTPSPTPMTPNPTPGPEFRRPRPTPKPTPACPGGNLGATDLDIVQADIAMGVGFGAYAGGLWGAIPGGVIGFEIGNIELNARANCP